MAMTSLHWMTHPPEEFTRGAVTVGNFDGVHRGHRELVLAARRQAPDGPVVAVTFDPPPLQLLAPHVIKPPLSTLTDRIDWLTACGADHVLILETDAGLLSLSPEAFFEDVLVGLLRAQAVVEGYNFRFGRARTGGVSTLRELCHGAGVKFEEVPPLLVRGEAVSSSRIRLALNRGDVTEAAELLGRPYTASGQIITGAKRGRTLGFPTANLAPTETLLPADGVYAVRAMVNDVSYPAAANIGPNPTFGEEAKKIEVHLIGFTGDIYGQRLHVTFVERLRATQPFSGVPALVEQLQRDITRAREICESQP
jgi:riboflavin kinase / FMN adenylyltransferase